jgi:metallo-beta-lactamase class B
LRRLTLREALIVLLVVSVAPAILLGRAWKSAVDRSRQAQAAEPFRIAGNFYYVGTNNASAFLLTSPEGHVLLGPDDNDASFIIASIATLGFTVKDVKALVMSEAHGLAALQQASGAQSWASDASADVIAAGGDNPDMPFPMRMVVRMGIGALSYPPTRVDHRVKDGETIRVGPIALTAHIAGGSSRGCTAFSFPVRDNDRVLTVVSACDLRASRAMRYAGQREDVERGISVLRSLPADIWVTGNSRAWGRYRKFAASKNAKNPADSFIDPDGYRAFLADAETELPTR